MALESSMEFTSDFCGKLVTMSWGMAIFINWISWDLHQPGLRLTKICMGMGLMDIQTNLTRIEGALDSLERFISTRKYTKATCPRMF